MFTIVASSTTMSCASARITRIVQRLVWWGLAVIRRLLTVAKWISAIRLYRQPTTKLDTVNPLSLNFFAMAETKHPERPLRKDAERNRQRILDAARELFAEEGLGVTLNDIAHHAGVGVGTVYRRFPEKTQLIEELFEQRLEDLVALASRALDEPDAWQGLKTFLQRALELQANDRGVKDLITASTDGLDRVAQIRSRLMPIGLELIARARAAGQIRS